MILIFENGAFNTCIDTTQIACVRTSMEDDILITLSSGNEMRLRCSGKRSEWYGKLVEAIKIDHLEPEAREEHLRKMAEEEKHAALRRELDDKIEMEYLPPRCQYAVELIAGKSPTYRDLLKHKRSEFLEIRNFGKKSLIYIDDMIDMAGLSWGMEV